MAKRKATNIQNMMEVRLESPEAIAEAMGTNDPNLAQRLVNQVYETLTTAIRTYSLSMNPTPPYPIPGGEWYDQTRIKAR